MFNNNLIIKNEEILIPQNDNSFFMFESLFLKNSLELIIQPFEDIDTINLYIIVKSLTSNIIYTPHSVLIAVTNNENFIVHNISISNFKKMNYFNFINWFNKQLEYDKKYIRENGKYKLIFTYPVEIFDRNLIPNIRPKYPWNNEILYSLNNIIEEEESKNKIIEIQKKKIEYQENKIKELENKIKQ